MRLAGGCAAHCPCHNVGEPPIYLLRVFLSFFALVFCSVDLAICAAPPFRPPLFLTSLIAGLPPLLFFASPPCLCSTALAVVAMFCRRTGRESYLPLSPSRRAVLSLVFPVVVAAVQGCVGFGLLGRVPASRAFLYGDLLVQDLNRVFWLWGFGLIFFWFGLKGYASKLEFVFESEIVLPMVKCTTTSLISGRGVQDSESMKVHVRNYSLLPDPLARGCIGQRYMIQGAAVPFWRAAGMTYISYSNICANLVRNCLKEPFKSEALAREKVLYSISKFEDGKPQKPIPVSHSTDLAGLGLIALELALENATNTFWIISGMLTKNESDLRCSSCLESCMELYLEMNIKLEESIGEYVSGKKHDAIYLWVSEIMQATNKCEAGFKEESNESPLTRENNTLSQLCGIILCIIDLISSDLNSWS
uniref:ATP synthase subunit epsilon, mitochondrial n=1 Tax=Chenopodium quinoa TaxID=63459 RepID=A0A803LU95_CHEQI